MLGMINKTDKLDTGGLNRLQQCGTLPTPVDTANGDKRQARTAKNQTDYCKTANQT